MILSKYPFVALAVAGVSAFAVPQVASALQREDTVGSDRHLSGTRGARAVTNAQQSSKSPANTWMSKAERNAIAALRTAIDKKDYDGAQSALSTARAAARYKEAKYVVAVLQLQLGQATGNVSMKSEAIEAALTTGLVPKAALAELRQMRAALTAESGQVQEAPAAPKPE